MGLMGGYVGRSRISGVAASGVGAAVLVAVPPPVWVGSQVRFPIVCALAVSAFGTGTLLTYQAVRLPAPRRDLDFGRVIGVSWKHWLWLWLPWQYFVANLVWLGTPGFILVGNKPSVTTLTSGIVTSVIGVGAVGYTGLRAVRSLRADAPRKRGQAAARFVLWFAAGPVLVNLWRVLKT
jgi:hypothetical protein